METNEIRWSPWSTAVKQSLAEAGAWVSKMGVEAGNVTVRSELSSLGILGFQQQSSPPYPLQTRMAG
jgi:hypothetical protein